MDIQQQFFSAIKADDKTTVTTLLAADPTLVTAKMGIGLSAILFAVYYGKSDIVQLLLAHNPQLDIFEATAVGKLDQVEVLLNTQPELVNASASDGFTPLGLASFFGYLEIVTLLLTKGAKVNVASRNDQHVMPLHSSVASRNIPISKVLLEHGADVNAKQQEDFTPLLEAAHNGQLEMVELLLSYGADIHAKTADGHNAIDMARTSGHESVVTRLTQ